MPGLRLAGVLKRPLLPPPDANRLERRGALRRAVEGIAVREPASGCGFDVVVLHIVVGTSNIHGEVTGLHDVYERGQWLAWVGWVLFTCTPQAWRDCRHGDAGGQSWKIGCVV